MLMNSNPNTPALNLHPIQLIEDDMAVAQSLLMLLTSSNYTCVHYKNAEDFFAAVANNPQALSLPSCIISDIRLAKLSGLDLLNRITQKYPECVWPVILMTGHGDVEMAVNAMQKGCFDFMSKPFDPFMLITKLHDALVKSVATQKKNIFLSDYLKKHEHLTDQEKRICELILQNLTSREIAEVFGNSTRTVEVHRAAIFKKMGVASVVELAQLAERYSVMMEEKKLVPEQPTLI